MMSINNMHISSGANLLAWRRLHLSRAKLKATSRTSALLSGFAMIGMVEISIDADTEIDEGLLIAYAVMTTLLVAVHLLALMISTCILPNLEAVSNTMSSIQDSPHEQMHCYIEMAWAFSTGLGILLFLAEIALLCWVKFSQLGEKGRNAAIVSSVIVAPVCVVFIVFALNFYRKLVDHKFDHASRHLEELENMHSVLQTV